MDDSLTTCNCCPDEPAHPRHFNPPGQERLNYRIGTHGAFLRRMIASLTRLSLPDGDSAGQKPLLDLSTREKDDPSIALLDAWAVAADILAFYQERIANEAYLLTAQERRSILELARAIGYELSPGVAATAYLAFTLEEANGASEPVSISKGTAVQSIPAKSGEKPQTFETLEDFTGYPAWNKLRPQLTETQTVADIRTAPKVYLAGTDTRLQQGDMLLLVDNTGSEVQTAARRVTEVDPDFTQEHTVAFLEILDGGSGGSAVSGGGGSVAAPSGGAASFAFGTEFTGDNVDHLVYGMTLSEASLQAVMGVYAWNPKDLLSYTPEPPSPGLSVFVFRESSGLFGHNAPRWETLPDPGDTRGGSASDPYEDPWDGTDARTIWEDSQGDTYTQADVYLERPIKGINQDSWVVFISPGSTDRPAFQVQAAFESSRVDFGLSGKVTGLNLLRADGETPEQPGDLMVRETTAYVKSEQLTLAVLPITTDIEKGSVSLTLNNLVLGLAKGQPVALTGEQLDAAGVIRSEIQTIKEINHSSGRTTLTFNSKLVYGYQRGGLEIVANVVAASHGERVPREVLGSGQGSQKNQRFVLKKPPLTYVSSSAPDGTDSTLVVQVEGVKWMEATSLYPLGPDERAYIVRRDNEGNTTVIFGDGRHGARLPTGQENVTAAYRSGIGTEGEVDANRLTMLKTKPLGVKGVDNPAAASGAGDPETLDTARENAPLTVRTLDRIVSLRDYTDFAQAFAGIGKAQAVALWSGEKQLVHITIATETGEQVQDPLLSNLRDAIEAARDPLQEVRLASFQPRYFHLKANLLVDEAYEWDQVEADVRQSLEDHFQFDERGFAQPVTAAEILNLIHDRKGVLAVDLDELHLVDESGSPQGPLLETVLIAEAARWNEAETNILPAELLLINPPGINLAKMTKSQD